jgi:hypothetical protein
MADSLNLSLWFPSFQENEMVPRTVSVMRQFLFSEIREGITYLSVHPTSWSEPTVLEQRFNPGVLPEEAAEVASEFVNDDFAFVFEAFWDLWVPNEGSEGDAWVQRPVAVRFIAHGVQFDEGIYTDDGHVEVDFGLDTPFLFDGVSHSPKTEEHVRYNVAKLVAFTMAVQKNVKLSGRVLWSESESNLAQKLVAQLQQVQ